MADFVREVCEPAPSRSKKVVPPEATLVRLTEVVEHLQYVVTEGCFDELREMVCAFLRGVCRRRNVREHRCITLFGSLRCSPSFLLCVVAEL